MLRIISFHFVKPLILLSFILLATISTNAQVGTENCDVYGADCTGSTSNNTTSTSKSSDSLEPQPPSVTCNQAFQAASSACDSMSRQNQNIQNMAAAAAGVGNQVSNVSDGYKATANAQTATASALGYMAQKCLRAASNCQNKCKLSENTNAVSSCGSMKNDAYYMIAQAGLSGWAAKQNYDTSKKVQEANRCFTDKGYTDPSCPVFCTIPQNANHDACKNKNNMADLCKDPQYYAIMRSQCECVLNPQHPSCNQNIAMPNGTVENSSTLTSLSNTPNPEANPLEIPDELFPSNQEYAGNAGLEVKPSSVQPPGAGGGGGPSALGGGGALPAPGGGGVAQGPFNTDIEKGGGGGAAGAVNMGPAGGYGSGGTPTQVKGGGYAGTNQDPKFDWKSLMPKDKNVRMPSTVNAEMLNNGITASTGLTNFQKITKKMNEKRPQLLP